MLSAQLQISDQDVRTVSANKGGELFGQVAGTADGRSFAYGLNGTGSGTALAPGKMTQGATAISGHTNKTGQTLAAGASQVSFTVSSTAVTAGQYTDGYFYVNAGTGVGQNLRIAGNNAATSTGTPIFNLHDDLITATLVSDSKFSVQPNPYSKLVITAHASPTISIPTGAPLISVPDANYAWFQIGGPASVLADASSWSGVADDIILSSLTDGAVGIEGTSTITPRVGYAMMTLVSAQYTEVFLQINNA